MLQSPKDAAQKEAFEAEVRLIDSGAKLAPDVFIRSSESKSIGGRSLFVGLEKYAATAGDVWLLDEGSGVLIIGNLITLPAPFLDTACPAKWNAALDKLSALKFDVAIPGHGAPLTKHQFELYRRAFSELLACARSADAKELCINRWTTAVKPLTSDDEKFTRSLMSYYVDVLRKSSDHPKALCGE